MTPAETPTECGACFYLTDNFGHGHTVLCWSHVAEKDRQLAEARELARDCILYMESHSSNTSEEETALVIRSLLYWAHEKARRALGDGK